MQDDTKLPRWRKAIDYVPHALSALVVVWLVSQCQATTERQKTKVWRLDQCFVGQHTGESRCIKGTQLWTREDCAEASAGLRSLPGFISSECVYDEGDPKNRWKPSP